MKPWLPHHAYTRLHRIFGGLHRLECVRAYLADMYGERAHADIHILCIQEADMALPLAALGYQVTVLAHGEEAVRLRQDAEDAHIVTCHARPDPEQGKEYDVALVGKEGVLNSALPAKACLGFCAAKKFVFARDAMVQSGWQPENMDIVRSVLSDIFETCAKRCVPGHWDIFHGLDTVASRLQHWMALSWGHEWIFRARKVAGRELVMHIMPTLGAGGAERVVFDLASSLPQKGYDVETVGIIRGGEMEPAFRQAGLPVQVLHRRGLVGLGAVWALRRLMRIMGPRIVHTHLFGADVWGAVAARLARIPLTVSTEHSINKDYSFKHLWLKRAVVPLFQRFIAVSTETEQYLHAVQYVPQGKVAIVRNGIDMERLIPRGNRPFANEPVLTIVARLISSKGHRVLFEALSQMMDRRWRLRVIGNGPEERALREEAERLGILSRIEWLGFRTDIPELLSQADVFCFPSQWEGLGLALIEAAATGVPIISSDLPALREVVDAAHASFVMPDDVEGWRDALLQVLDRQDWAIQRAVEHTPQVRERFSLERMAVGYAAVYRRLVSL